MIDEWEALFNGLKLTEKQKEAIYVRLAINDTALRAEYAAKSWGEYTSGCATNSRHHTIISLHQTILMCKAAIKQLQKKRRTK